MTALSQPGQHWALYNIHTNALSRCALTHQSDIRLLQTSSDMNIYILKLVKVQIFTYVSLNPNILLVSMRILIATCQPLINIRLTQQRTPRRVSSLICSFSKTLVSLLFLARPVSFIHSMQLKFSFNFLPENSATSFFSAVFSCYPLPPAVLKRGSVKNTL